MSTPFTRNTGLGDVHDASDARALNAPDFTPLPEDVQAILPKESISHVKAPSVLDGTASPSARDAGHGAISFRTFAPAYWAFEADISVLAYRDRPQPTPARSVLLE